MRQIAGRLDTTLGYNFEIIAAFLKGNRRFALTRAVTPTRAICAWKGIDGAI